jgi:predicted transcriptional regulator
LVEEFLRALNKIRTLLDDEALRFASAIDDVKDAQMRSLARQINTDTKAITMSVQTLINNALLQGCNTTG